MAPRTRGSTRSEDNRSYPDNIAYFLSNAGPSWNQDMTMAGPSGHKYQDNRMLDNTAGFQTWMNPAPDTYPGISNSSQPLPDVPYMSGNELGNSLPFQAEPGEINYSEPNATQFSQPSNWMTSAQANNQVKGLDRNGVQQETWLDGELPPSNEDHSDPNQPLAKKRQRIGKFLCSEPNCKSTSTERGGFGTRNDLERHYRDIHYINMNDRSPVRLYFCPWTNGCSRHLKAFTRSDNYKQHLIKKHNGQEPEVQDTSVRNQPNESNTGELSRPSELMTQVTRETPDQIEDVDHPIDLTIAEQGNRGLVGLFQIASGWCNLAIHQNARLESITQKLEVLEQSWSELEKQKSKIKHTTEYLQKLLTKRARTEEQQRLTREEIARINLKEQKHAENFESARVRLEELQESRDDVRNEMPQITKKAQFYISHLCNKRKEFRKPTRTNSDRQNDSFAAHRVSSPDPIK